MNNFIKRALTGFLFVALLVGGILYHPLTFGLLFACVTALSLWEFATLVNTKGEVYINRLITTVAGVYMFFAFMGFSMNLAGSEIFIPYLVALIYLLIAELYLKQPNPVGNWAYTMMSQLYVALPFALLNILYFHTDSTGRAEGVVSNPILPLSVFIFLWASDTGAYCVGSLIGKHRLFERISPKKSWEGSIGGALLAIAAACLIAHYHNFLTLWQWVGLAVVVVVFGTWGDLIESLIKRQFGIKDSGNILPGHGGMLDRFDSCILAVPAVVVYLYTLTIW